MQSQVLMGEIPAFGSSRMRTTMKLMADEVTEVAKKDELIVTLGDVWFIIFIIMVFSK